MRNAVVKIKPEVAEIAQEVELPDLPQQQFSFINDICEGKTASQAYADNYECRQLTPGAIATRATMLRHSPAVKQWLSLTRQADISNAMYTRDQHIAELEEVKAYSLAQGVPGAAVQAITAKGKVMGYYEDRIRISDTPDVQDLINQLRDQIGPDVANAFAAKLMGKATSPEDEQVIEHAMANLEDEDSE